MNNISTYNNKGVKNLIAKTDKPVVSNSFLTRNIVQTSRQNQPAVFGDRGKNLSLSPSRQVNINKKFLPDKSPAFAHKKTLILDLDETLVHSGFKPFKTTSDMILKIELEGRVHDIHVLIRPGAHEFLEKMSEIYELVIFTASLSKYADPLVDRLDPKKRCIFRLFREHCTVVSTERGMAYVKDLRYINRDLTQTIILDNNPNSYAVNIENGMPIKTWIDDMKDRELFNYIPLLEYLSNVKNVQDILPKMITNNEIDYNKSYSLIKNERVNSLTPQNEKKSGKFNNITIENNKNLFNNDEKENKEKSYGTQNQNNTNNNTNTASGISNNNNSPTNTSINIKIINHNVNNYIVKSDNDLPKDFSSRIPNNNQTNGTNKPQKSANQNQEEKKKNKTFRESFGDIRDIGSSTYSGNFFNKAQNTPYSQQSSNNNITSNKGMNILTKSTNISKTPLVPFNYTNETPKDKDDKPQKLSSTKLPKEDKYSIQIQKEKEKSYQDSITNSSITLKRPPSIVMENNKKDKQFGDLLKQELKSSKTPNNFVSNSVSFNNKINSLQGLNTIKNTGIVGYSVSTKQQVLKNNILYHEKNFPHLQKEKDYGMTKIRTERERSEKPKEKSMNSSYGNNGFFNNFTSLGYQKDNKKTYVVSRPNTASLMNKDKQYQNKQEEVSSNEEKSHHSRTPSYTMNKNVNAFGNMYSNTPHQSSKTKYSAKNTPLIKNKQPVNVVNVSSNVVGLENPYIMNRYYQKGKKMFIFN